MIGKELKAGIILVAMFALIGVTATATDTTTAGGDMPVAGTVTGGYLDTLANDSIYESIEEWESDERLAKKRISYLEHKWTFDVPAGDSFAFHIKAYHSANTEGDDFEFSWSTDDTAYTGFLVVTRTADDGTYQSAALPSGLGGTVYIRVMDTDRTKDRRVLDTIFIDHMYIESSGGDEPPAAPSGLQASAQSSSTIELGWADNSGNEDGFCIERSLDGFTWDPPVIVGVNVTSLLDTNLLSDTTYFYRVLAFNGHGDSSWSNTASGTTHPEGSFITQMVDPYANPNYMSHAFNPGTGRPGIGYCGNGLIKFAQWNGLDWEIEALPTGGGTDTDFAYSPGGTPSMSYLSGQIYFAEKVGPTWSIEAVTDGGDFSTPCMAYDPDGNPSIAYTQTWFKKNRGLKLATRIGTTWIIETIDSGMPGDKSLAYDLQGFPAVAYRGDDSLNYAHWNGAVWNIETVESGTIGSGIFADLAFDPITGWPAMVHLPSPSYEVMEIRFVRWDGMEWQGETIAQGDLFSPALAYDDSGTPYITYVTGAMGTLPAMALWIAHFDGNDWVHELVESDIGGVWNPGLCIEPNGLPTLSYSGSVDGVVGLKFAFKENP